MYCAKSIKAMRFTDTEMVFAGRQEIRRPASAAQQLRRATVEAIMDGFETVIV